MIRILIFSALFLVFLISADRASAHPAWGIAADRHGRVYFSDLKTVWKIDAEGRPSVFRAGGHTHDLNVDEAGNVYGEQDFSSIWKMTSAGNFSYLFPPSPDPPRGVSIWRDREGNMFSVELDNHLKRETLLLKRTPEGRVSVLAGGRYGHADGKGSRAMFRNIVGMTFGPDGSLYLVDGPAIRRVTMDGTVTTLIRKVAMEKASGRPADGTSLFGITVDAKANVYVADYGNRRILKVTPGRQMTSIYRSNGSWYPTGVAERDGVVYILEESHTSSYQPLGTRVTRLSPDGKPVVLAAVGESISENPSNSERSFDAQAASAAEPPRSAATILWSARVNGKVNERCALCFEMRLSIHSSGHRGPGHRCWDFLGWLTAGIPALGCA